MIEVVVIIVFTLSAFNVILYLFKDNIFKKRKPNDQEQQNVDDENSEQEEQ